LPVGQNVISLLVAENESISVLTATENGFGKRTPITEYTRHGRGTQGMIAIQTSARNGNVVAATLVEDKDEIMLITTGGVLIRTRVAEIRQMSRATQGVTLINLGPDEKLAGLQKIVDSDDGVVEGLDVGADEDSIEPEADENSQQGQTEKDGPDEPA
ncbi:MAG: DNA gyrase subunit A, partial [Prolixibacteraceae bacterium]|nr:DNA gyrase subunit A [Burkholderiales bacterium]